MTKKSFVKTLASKIQKEHNVQVNIINSKISMKEIHEAVILSKDTNIVTLIAKNSETEEYFDEDKIVIVIWNGHSTIVPRTVQVKHILTRDNDLSCKICLDDYKSGGSRSCCQCSRSFCVKCQIKFMINGATSGANSMKCPYCKFEHTIGNSSLETFIDTLMVRLYKEECVKVLSQDDINELLEYLQSNINETLEFHSSFA